MSVLQSVRQSREVLIPLLLLAVFGFVTWLTVFSGGLDDVQPNLKAHRENEADGIWAVHHALDRISNAVPVTNDEQTGLLAGVPTSISVRYEEAEGASTWLILVRGPVRVRPNTPEEFVSKDSEILVELTALNVELVRLSAGRGVLSSLDISPDGFINVPFHLVWPPRSVWIFL